MAANDVVLEVSGRDVKVSSPAKVFFPEHGETKLDLVEFYLAISEPFMTALRGRPTMLERYPDGAAGKSFFQKRIPESAPDWLQTTVVSTPNGTTSNALVLADMAHVVWAVNQGCLGFHPWPYVANRPEFSDELRIDLDPQPGVTFDMVRTAAQHTHDLLHELGIESWAKTTGNRGLHIYVRLEPRWDSYQVRQAAIAVARELARRHPDLVTDAWWKEGRGTRVFVDFNQNAPHKTVFGAWCVRPRVGAQVSSPFAWRDLPTIEPDLLTMFAVARRFAGEGDPWAESASNLQSLAPLLELWERDLRDGYSDASWPPVYPKMPGEPPRVSPSRAKKP